MKSGVIPLWNPYNSYGAPFLADIQTCVFYPFSLLLYLPDFRWAFNFYILVHLALAGAFCCAWMRECDASHEASFLAGIAYCLGGYVMSAISVTISLATLVYFPLALLTLKRSLVSHSFFWKAMAALLLLVQYLGGDPAVFFATLVVLTLFIIYKTILESVVRRTLFLKYALDYLKIIVTFLGLSAFHTLLFFEFLCHSNRALLGYDQVTMWSVQYNDLVSIFFPYFSDLSLAFMSYWERQSWLENAYAGITVMLLACAALKGVRENRRIGYHVLLALFGIALCLGRFCLLYTILYQGFPFFRFIRYPVRFLFLFHFAVACLAGFGLDVILSHRGKQGKPFLSRSAACALASLILILLLLVILTMIYSQEIEQITLEKAAHFLSGWMKKDMATPTVIDLVVPVLANLKRTTILLCLFLMGVLAAWHFKPKKGLLLIFFMLLVTVDLVEANVIEIRLSEELFKNTGKNIAKVLEDKTLFRVLASPESVKLQYEPPGEATLELTMHSLMETLTPNLLLPYQVSDVSGYDSIFLRESIEINSERRNLKNPTRQRFFDMLNIKYVVSPKEKIGGNYHLAQKSHPANLFINGRVLPRAFLVPNVTVVQDRKDILKKLIAEDYDPEKLIYLEEEPPSPKDPTLSVGESGSQNKVLVNEYSPNRVRMKLYSSHSQWLFFSDMHYPGWKAILDGREVKIFRANYTFRAIRVPTGPHTVEWKYDPILFRIGVVVSFFTALALAVYFFRGMGTRNA